MLSPVKSTNSAANLWQWHLKLNLDKLKIWGCVLCSVKALRLNIVVGCVNHSHSLCLSCPASTWLSRQSFGQMHIWKETADHCQGCIGLNKRPAVGVRISSMGCPVSTHYNPKGDKCQWQRLSLHITRRPYKAKHNLQSLQSKLSWLPTQNWSMTYLRKVCCFEGNGFTATRFSHRSSTKWTIQPNF